MSAAKAVQGVAQGGMVLLSEQTFRQLPGEAMRTELLIAHAGEHMLEKGCTSVVHVYQAMETAIILRSVLMGPVR